ncbi:MAG TPA: zf-TFIIB domain-containing protein [Candidatus Margulisiibacteriota bacterium]|nr:zf-TFIIB domain-containing protein [Candidatus Margulisiibacteriota bacterium]
MATEEKDRLGSKLRDAERAREDQYFAERDRQLIDRLRQSKGGEKTAAAEAGQAAVSPEATPMTCPRDGTPLNSHTLHDVSVDECPSCHGMWLDAGELEALGRWENAGWIARWLRSEFRRKD